MADISFDERRRIVETALKEARGSDAYVVELYDDHAIYEQYEAEPGRTFEVPYTLDGDKVTFGDRVEVRREVSYQTIKRASQDVIEGLAMPFGYDVDGESFTPDTDFCFEWFGKSGRPFLFDHGLDPSLKGTVIGRQTDYELRDEGIWAQVQLDRNARYRKAVDSLIDARAIGFSSGAMPHLATKNAKGEITRWPWVELSGTPIPAHPAALSIHYVKSADAIRHLEAVKISIPDPLKAALTALDEWADSRDAAPVSERLADRLDRVSTELEGLHEHVREYAAMRVKSGRSLPVATRDRLVTHPAALRDLADELDGLLATKSTPDLTQLALESQALIARTLGVALPSTETH